LASEANTLSTELQTHLCAGNGVPALQKPLILTPDACLESNGLRRLNPEALRLPDNVAMQ